jgi:hypothetical protein
LRVIFPGTAELLNNQLHYQNPVGNMGDQRPK